MARELGGPWITPPVDTFDGRALYAAKTAADGERRLLFGWNPTRAGESDTGGWQWGGNLAVHELAQREDGALTVRIPQEVSAAYNVAEPVRFARAWNAELPASGGSVWLDAESSFSAVSAGTLPEAVKIVVQATWKEGAKGFGVLLRGSEDFESGYYVRIEPQRQRLVFDSWPRAGDLPHMVEIERPVRLQADHAVRLEVTLQGTLCEVYLNDEVAMSARMYNHTAGVWGLFAQEAEVEFWEVGLYRISEE
jgi:beta-fructofuranosidase